MDESIKSGGRRIGGVYKQGGVADLSLIVQVKLALGNHRLARRLV